MCENTCLMEYLQATASTRYPPDKLSRKFLKIFWKISKKTPLTKSCFKNDGNSRPVNFLKTQSHRDKRMTFVAYMLNINRNSSQPQILRKLLCAWLIQLNIFYLCPKLIYFFGFNYWIQHCKFEPYLESCQASKMESFVKNSERLLDIWQGSEYVSDIRQPAWSVQK